MESPVRDLCRKFGQFLSLVVVIYIASTFALGFQEPQDVPSQRGTGVTAGALKFRTVRSVSGSKGHLEGTQYVIDDPRTVFRVPDDRQVVVYFEWEGPPGLHACEAWWKTPDGKIGTVTDFKFDSKDSRFAGYFVLLLAEKAPQGLWTVEAKVDGESAGTHNFQVLGPSGDAPAPKQDRAPLSASEIYQRASAASVSIERMDSAGTRIDAGAGFFLDPNTLITAFQMIEGATYVRIIFPDGERVDVDQAVSWNKWQDWAAIRLETGSRSFLEIAKEPPSVGDRIYSLEFGLQANRIIVQGIIGGKNTFPRSGDRFSLSLTSAAPAAGAPLLNEYGEAVGIVGGSLLPGLASLKLVPASAISAGALVQAHNISATPVALLPKIAGTGAAQKKFSDLANQGEFLPPLKGFQNVSYVSVTRRVEKKGSALWPADEASEFTPRDHQVSVFLRWDPKEKVKGQAGLRVYDLDNRLISESKRAKISVGPGDSAITIWKLDVAPLRAGIYRIDVLANADAIWRLFFRMRE